MHATSIWRLYGSIGRVMDCFIEPKYGTLHAVTVVLGTETFLEEAYPDPASARRRALQVRDNLLQGGGWTSSSGHSVPAEVALRVDCDIP